ncbi:tryptophanyl-tRNA synthetase [Paraphaeosphaeria sporulosa]
MTKPRCFVSGAVRRDFANAATPTSMLSRQSPRALRRAQSLRWPPNAVSRRAEATGTSSQYFHSIHAPDAPSERAPPHSTSVQAQKCKDRQWTRAPRIIFSGIQPTGVPHLGNYLGALRAWVKLQDEGLDDDKRFFSIVDLHAITVPQDPHTLLRRKNETYASLLAIGLDPNKSLIFMQSANPAHSELMWLLSCHASMGYLGRMTQWKSKAGVAGDADPLESAPNKPALKLGLFSYPVLQAADVLLYNATHVPVGEDQAQHLEFTRELAQSFNHIYARPDADPTEVEAFRGFNIPRTILSPAKRVMSLQDPTKKMSKSDPDERSRILITDTREQIQAKIKAALTDSTPGISYDRELRPGVSNLLDIMYYMDQSKYESPMAIARDFTNVSMRALKEGVATAVADHLEPIRERYNEQIARSQEDVDTERWNSGRIVGAQSDRNIQRVKQAMGLRPVGPLTSPE